MEMVMMSTFENLEHLLNLWTAFMAVVLLAVIPTRETMHHIVDRIYDMGNHALASLGGALVETLVLLGCGLVISGAILMATVEGAVAWVVEKAEARAAAKAAAKAKAEAEALAAFARRAREAGFVHKDEVRELVRMINELHSECVSWECDYNSLQGAFAGAEEEIVELNEIIDEMVRKKYPHGVQVRVEAVHDTLVKSIEDFNFQTKIGRADARTYLRENGIEIPDSTNGAQIAKKVVELLS